MSRDSVMFYGPAVSERHVFEKVGVSNVTESQDKVRTCIFL